MKLEIDLSVVDDADQIMFDALRGVREAHDLYWYVDRLEINQGFLNRWSDRLAKVQQQVEQGAMGLTFSELLSILDETFQVVEGRFFGVPESLSIPNEESLENRARIKIEVIDSTTVEVTTNEDCFLRPIQRAMHTAYRQ